MKLNENEIDEYPKIQKFFHKKKNTRENNLSHELLKLKRKRNTQDSLEKNNILLSLDKENFSDMIINEEIDIFNISDSGNSFSMNDIETDYSNGSNKSVCEQKILQLKMALQDKPYYQYNIIY